MSRLPTVGGDTASWGTVLNDFLDSDYGFYGLNGNVSAGATSIVIDRLPGIIQSNAGQRVLIDVGTTEAEMRVITTVSGNTLSFSRALTYAHTSGDPCFLVGLAAQEGLIPWSWWGGQPTGDTADATQNVTAFNRLIGPNGELYNDPLAPLGIYIDPGIFYVDDQLKPERSMVMKGISSLGSVIRAKSGFPFDGTGNVAIVHPYRDGSPVLYEVTGPSGRWWFKDFHVDGNSLTDSNGVISSPQQPDSTQNLRITHCDGLYGLALQDVQFHDIHQLQFDDCATALYMWSCSFVRVYNMSATSPSGSSQIVLLTHTTDSSFYGALLETMPTGGKMINCTGASSRLGFYDIYTSGFSGGSAGSVFYFDCASANPSNKCTYFISNAFCNQNASTINFVNDVQRSITFNTDADSDRSIILGWAQDSLYEFVLGGLGRIRTSGPIEFGASGPQIVTRAGSPEGAVTAPPGSLAFDSTNGENYIKKTGTGNTGWKLVTHAA